MEISQDDLNDMAQRAGDAAFLVKTISDALLKENIVLAGDLIDSAVHETTMLLRMLVRSGAASPSTPDRFGPWWQGYPHPGFEQNEQSIRAAQTLEKAALLVLALENEEGIKVGMGDTLADFAAELNMLVFSRSGDPD